MSNGFKYFLVGLMAIFFYILGGATLGISPQYVQVAEDSALYMKAEDYKQLEYYLLNPEYDFWADSISNGIKSFDVGWYWLNN